MYLYILFSNYKNEIKIKNKKEFGKKKCEEHIFLFLFSLLLSINTITQQATLRIILFHLHGDQRVFMEIFKR